MPHQAAATRVVWEAGRLCWTCLALCVEYTGPDGTVAFDGRPASISDDLAPIEDIQVCSEVCDSATDRHFRRTACGGTGCHVPPPLRRDRLRCANHVVWRLPQHPIQPCVQQTAAGRRKVPRRVIAVAGDVSSRLVALPLLMKRKRSTMTRLFSRISRRPV